MCNEGFVGNPPLLSVNVDSQTPQLLQELPEQ